MKKQNYHIKQINFRKRYVIITQENLLLQFRYTVEEMTQIILESTTLKVKVEVDPKIEKNKNRLNEFNGFYIELEVNNNKFRK